ncbi:centrosomal protein of 104 kDa [Brachionichthys hirsutus]|uniref:centrosomal protein of 104 kDa n=1 Tax=Brachionichthys hirsutus TaxID=412623 RepID=UPI0036051C3D
MPRKIRFTVINCSSHEENYSANELMVHAPTVNGWRSSRFCAYPQHITLQLVERSRVMKLQLLAHQYLIPSKVEFHIGDTFHESSPSAFPGHFHRLGYVPLWDNKKTGFKARELKSINVDAIGTYLKITFYSNHVNQYNHHNQVAVVAINVLGDSLDGSALDTVPSGEQLIEQYLNGTQLEAALDTTFMGKCESISPLDDLAFDMYQDPEVAHIIHLLDQRKQDMVRQEQYGHAKNMKQAIADLQKVGERLARYDMEKKCAIEKEDYNLAMEKKTLMEEYRRSVYQQLKVHNLLDVTMITEAADPPPAQVPSSLQLSGHLSVPTRHLMSTDTLKNEKKTDTRQSPRSDRGILAPKLNGHPACTPAGPQMDVTSASYNETLLPVLQRTNRPFETLHSPAEQHVPQHEAQRTSDSPEVNEEPLTESVKREAGLAIDVYGESLISDLYSKTWSNREGALLALHKKLLEVSPTTPKEELRNMIRAAVFLVKKTLLEKVSSVFHSSLKLLHFLLSQLIPGQAMGRTEMTHCLEQTWPNLLARTGETTTHLRTLATNFILEIAVLKDVRSLQIIPGDLVKPFTSNFPSRLAQSRVEMLKKLLAELGTENCGFTLENVIMFCTAAFKHSCPVVREEAVHIMLSLYQQHGAAVLSHLPPEDTATRKNFLYKTLFDGFAKSDGKLVDTQEKTNGGLKQQIPKKKAPKVERVSQKSGKAVTKQPREKLTTNIDVQQSLNYLDNLCIFCGKKDESFTEDGLDLHYWKHCPMLKRCDECRQVVEIESLTEHLLEECESRSKFSQCLCCSEAVASEDLSQHSQGSACNPPASGKVSNHCPLCHNNFVPGDGAWKAHLMGGEGCKQNSRWTVASQRTRPVQGRAVDGAELKEAWSVGARARPRGRRSRIPALVPMAKGHTPGKP